MVVDANSRDIVYCNKRKDEKKIDPENSAISASTGCPSGIRS